MKKRVCFIIESMEGGGTQKNLHILMNTFENDNVKLFLITEMADELVESSRH